MSKLVPARESRLISESNSKTAKLETKQFESIAKQIQKACCRNEFEIEFRGPLYDNVKIKLWELGYRIDEARICATNIQW